jgi:hypothetical protein
VTISDDRSTDRPTNQPDNQPIQLTTSLCQTPDCGHERQRHRYVHGNRCLEIGCGCQSWTPPAAPAEPTEPVTSIEPTPRPTITRTASFTYSDVVKLGTLIEWLTETASELGPDAQATVTVNPPDRPYAPIQTTITIRDRT